MNMNHLRYFPDMLIICALWKNESSSFYRQIRDKDFLTIPSTRSIKQLSSTVPVETGLSEDIMKHNNTTISQNIMGQLRKLSQNQRQRL